MKNVSWNDDRWSRKPDIDFIEHFNLLLEMMVKLNIIHPGAKIRLDEPENGGVSAADRDWVNRIVQRVVHLRTSGEDKDARAIVDKGEYRSVDDSMFYRCVCLRSDGSKERPDGKKFP